MSDLGCGVEREMTGRLAGLAGGGTVQRGGRRGWRRSRDVDEDVAGRKGVPVLLGTLLLLRVWVRTRVVFVGYLSDPILFGKMGSKLEVWDTLSVCMESLRVWWWLTVLWGEEGKGRKGTGRDRFSERNGGLAVTADSKTDHGRGGECSILTAMWCLLAMPRFTPSGHLRSVD